MTSSLFITLLFRIVGRIANCCERQEISESACVGKQARRDVNQVSDRSPWNFRLCMNWDDGSNKLLSIWCIAYIGLHYQRRGSKHFPSLTDLLPDGIQGLVQPLRLLPTPFLWLSLISSLASIFESSDVFECLTTPRHPSKSYGRRILVPLVLESWRIELNRPSLSEQSFPLWRAVSLPHMISILTALNRASSFATFISSTSLLISASISVSAPTSVISFSSAAIVYILEAY